MSVYPVGRAVIDQIIPRLSDNFGGWNAVFNDLASSYELPAPHNVMAIEFAPSDGKSKNFALADVDPKDWIDTGAFKFPLVTLYVDSSKNENLQKFHQFSGTVIVCMNVYLSWATPRLRLPDFEPLSSCVEETLYTIFNRTRSAFMGDQDWTDEVVYNGDLEVRQGRVARGADFWVQAIGAKLTFQVDQKGQV